MVLSLRRIRLVFNLFRKEYQEAKDQLAKGEEWFSNTLSKIVELQNWTYVGFIAFPNLENKGPFQGDDLLVTF